MATWEGKTPWEMGEMGEKRGFSGKNRGRSTREGKQKRTGALSRRLREQGLRMGEGRKNEGRGRGGGGVCFEDYAKWERERWRNVIFFIATGIVNGIYVTLRAEKVQEDFNMRKIMTALAILAGSTTAMMAQETLTLADCLRIGIENNLQLRTSRNEMTKARLGISENRARLLPQINAVVGFNDNFEPPVSVTDGSAYGKKYNVTKTLQYNASAGLQLQMPLYNQTLLTAMDIARTVDEMNRLTYEKAREDLMMQISKMYYLAQNTAEQIRLVEGNIGRLEELRDITTAFYENDMAVEVDVKRVNLNLENLTTQRDNARAMLEQQYNLLKYIIDYPAEAEIRLTAVNPKEDVEATAKGLSTGLYELQLLEQQKTLAGQQYKMVRQGYLPSLNLTANWMFTAYTDKARNWFKAGESSHWYRSDGVGLSLRIPIFDGLEKRAKSRKTRLDMENASMAYENALKNFSTQYMNATSDMKNSQRNYQRQYDNYLLAEDVYQVTSDQYREGVASMTDVLQDEMRVSEAQNNYLTAHYNLQVAQLTLLKLSGQLEELTR